jgi:rhamnulokinase
MIGSSPPNIVAVDLGAESCRVFLLDWGGREPRISLVHRFSNGPVQQGASLHWDLDRIFEELQTGLARGAEQSSSPIGSIGVDGWAVDYARLGRNGAPLGKPFCYRDLRTELAESEVKARCSIETLYSITGVQPQRINTLYQLVADRMAAVPIEERWVNLPEYVLAKLGGSLVAEYTNATHTGLVDCADRQWSQPLFDLLGLDMDAAPQLVPTGTELGRLRGSLSELDAFRKTVLIAPACHDTASAIAGISTAGDDWAYISSGTWSLIGTLLNEPILSSEACNAGFTNLGAAGNRICFHKNVNGMWILKQTLNQLCSPGKQWSMPELVSAAVLVDPPINLLDLDDPTLLLQDAMASRINAQRMRRGIEPLPEEASAMPAFASLIFHSLAHTYARVVSDLKGLTGKKLKQLSIVGGGSLNQQLNQLTAEATGLEVCCGIPESAILGNFAAQLSTLEGQPNATTRIAYWSCKLATFYQG